MSDTHTKKRPRPVVSCLRCRGKKLKCNRTLPCENCIKASCAGICTYNRDAGSTSRVNGFEVTGNESIGVNNRYTRSPTVANSNSVSSFSSSALEDLQVRLARVEEMLGVRDEQSERVEREQITTSTPQTLLGTLVVKGKRSVYHGQNDRVTLLNQFLEVKEFIHNEVSKDGELLASAKQVKFLQNKSLLKAASPDVAEPEFSMALLKLREFLPPKSYCDRLVAIYCRNFERTMRILHVPTFLHQYEQIWTNTNPDICTSSAIIPQVTAVLTIAYHLDDSRHVSDDEPHRTYLKQVAIELIQAWLDEVGRKQRTELTTLQVEALMVMSNSLREVSLEKFWGSAGTLVRSAMMMGLHTSPSSIPNITPYQLEMRRRMWATVLEIDLQASMHAGMPNMVSEVNITDFVPANINDSDFDESTEVLPLSRPMSIQTDNSFQVHLASSLPLRLKALSLVHRSTSNMDEAVEVGRKIAEYLSSKPPGLSLSDQCNDPLNAGGSLLHRVLLDLYARRPLLYLYKPLLLRTQPSSPTHAEIKAQCLESSLTVLSYQDNYTTPSLLAITRNPTLHQTFFHRCCKNDILWAALTICQHVKTLPPSQTHTQLLPPVEKAINYLISRIDQKGTHIKDIVFLSLALQSATLPLSSSSQTRSLSLHHTATKTLSACRDRLMQTVIDTEPKPEPAESHPHSNSHPQLQPHYHDHDHDHDHAHKRPNSTHTSTQHINMDTSIDTDTPPLPSRDPPSLFTPPADMALGSGWEGWCGHVPGWADEFSAFQGGLFDGGEGGFEFEFGGVGMGMGMMGGGL